VSVDGTTYRRVEQVMGMPISLALRGDHAEGQRADEAWAAAIAELRDVDRVFSTYQSGSVISRLDRGDLALADCPPEVTEMLAIAEQARIESHGAFDVRRPDADGVVRLDPSGVVKGWAVQRAAAAFESLEGTDYCLSAGGDMVCRSRRPDSPGWRIGIEDPREPGRIVAVVPVRNGAVATSGTAHRGEHLEDPRTGRTPAALASVTVVGDDLTWVDIEATAAFVLGDDAASWLAGRAGRTGLIVYADGRTELFGDAAEVR
jgi:thiamine biosynthesis lipoprotein